MKDLKNLLFKNKIYVILGLIILSLIIFGQRLLPEKHEYTPYTVRSGDLTENITVSGNVNSLDSAAIFTPSTGIVKEIYVKNGDFVEKDQDLLKIESTATEAEKVASYATYQDALSALQTAKQNRILNQSSLEEARKAVIDASLLQQQMNDRRNTGRPNPLTGNEYKQDEIESINSNLNSARQSFSYYEKKYLDSDTAISAAQSSLSSSWLSYEGMVKGIIRAPVSGQIINLASDTGDEVIAKTPQNDPMPVLRINRKDSLSVKIKINELDVNSVHPGQEAEVVFDAIPNKNFKAVVERMDTSGTNKNAAVTYLTYLKILSKDERIKPEMTATVKIITDPKKNVLIIPNTALTKENNKLFVMTSKDGSSKRPVTIGVKNETQSEVISGLSEGEIIYLPVNK